ncbi:hypothetical protein [Streptococcus sp. O1]|nr:hypothetical protein [Streptococcus sp. O1]
MSKKLQWSFLACSLKKSSSSFPIFKAMIAIEVINHCVNVIRFIKLESSEKEPLQILFAPKA